MKTFAFLFLMIVFIVLLSNLGTIIERNNGIPDFAARVMPESALDIEERTAVETGMAPFAAAENAAQPVELHPEIKYDPLGKNVNVTESLELAHRHEAAVNEWVTETVSEALNFTIQNYMMHTRSLTNLMNANAIKEFQAFMETSQILGLMKTKNYELKSFVTDLPAMRTSGVVEDRYRWVYDVPINLTFLPAGSKSYEELAEDQYQFETLTFRVQVGRVAVPDTCKDIALEKQKGVCHGMVIETWEALKKQKPAEEKPKKNP